jgi:hypothetical protein
MVASMDSKIKRDWKKIQKGIRPLCLGKEHLKHTPLKTLKKVGECREQFVLPSGWVKIKVQL